MLLFVVMFLRMNCNERYTRYREHLYGDHFASKEYAVRSRMSKLQLDVLLFVCFFFGADCGGEPPVTPPNDSLITTEKELTDGEQPAISPDGRKIAYTYEGDIYVIDTSGTNITQLTSGTEIDFMPRWHPNGLTVGFLRMPPGEMNDAGISTVPATGGAVTAIPLNHPVSNTLKRQTETYSGIGMPLWDYSPDGSYIAFLSQEADTTFLNVVRDPTGEAIVHMNLFGPFDDTPCFAWSLNGGEIAFIAQEQDFAGKRKTRAQLLKFLDGTLRKDSLLYDAAYITRAPKSNKFAYNFLDASTLSVMMVITDFLGLTIKYPLVGGGLKWSPDEKYFLGNRTETISGPFGYSYHPLSIHDIETGKKYQLTQKADINRYNLYFEWGKGPNTVFFERFGKINEVRFQIPNIEMD